MTIVRYTIYSVLSLWYYLRNIRNFHVILMESCYKQNVCQNSVAMLRVAAIARSVPMTNGLLHFGLWNECALTKGCLKPLIYQCIA